MAANLPRARVNMPRRTRGGRVLCLSRKRSQKRNATTRDIPRIRKVIMSKKRAIRIVFWICCKWACVHLHGVCQPCGASSPCPSTNVISANPTVTRAAPVQSTRLSDSVLGLSPSMEKRPIRNVKAVSPAPRKKTPRQPKLSSDRYSQPSVACQHQCLRRKLRY